MENSKTFALYFEHLGAVFVDLCFFKAPPTISVVQTSAVILILL